MKEVREEFHWEPVEVEESGDDVLSGLEVGEFWTYWSLSRILLVAPTRRVVQRSSE